MNDDFDVTSGAMPVDDKENDLGGEGIVKSKGDEKEEDDWDDDEDEEDDHDVSIEDEAEKETKEDVEEPEF